MPHERDRHIKELLIKSLKYSPIVGILGHRQVGKTTLSSALSSTYFTLDLKQILDTIQDNPMQFLENNRGKPLVIDECQLAAELFPALKEFVRVNKKPGQILLTGSVRFTSRKVITESLTGRIINWELLPMNYSELNSLPLSDKLVRFLGAKSIEVDINKKPLNLNREIIRYLKCGGLPGIFSLRDEAIRFQKFETQLQAMIERDLKLILDTSLSFRTILLLVKYFVDRQGVPLNYADASRSTRISIPTIKKLLYAFEAMFLVRVYDSEGGQKAPVLYFEDQGEASHLMVQARTEFQEVEHYFYANFRSQWMYRPELSIRMTQYRTRSGAVVPFVLRDKKNVLGILPIADENPSFAVFGSARSFLSENPHAKVLYVHGGTTDKILNSRERIISMGALM
ncbi:MAG TPA: AAA family ATPase [Oligoflexia bacterium]|nr:AAA family ATPase [Oligoflexia bacterium]HMP49563.1 AAA family ATPase [Oligoflexia bacterium]